MSSPNTKLIALIVAGAFFMQHLDSSIIGTSLPQMAAALGVPTLSLSVGMPQHIRNRELDATADRIRESSVPSQGLDTA